MLVSTIFYDDKRSFDDYGPNVRYCILSWNTKILKNTWTLDGAVEEKLELSGLLVEKKADCLHH